jgi:hypothetical protein
MYRFKFSTDANRLKKLRRRLRSIYEKYHVYEAYTSLHNGSLAVKRAETLNPGV